MADKKKASDLFIECLEAEGVERRAVARGLDVRAGAALLDGAGAGDRRAVD